MIAARSRSASSGAPWGSAEKKRQTMFSVAGIDGTLSSVQNCEKRRHRDQYPAHVVVATMDRRLALTVASSAGASSREEYRKRRNTDISSSLAALCPAVAVSRTGRGASASLGIVATVGKRRAMGRARLYWSRAQGCLPTFIGWRRGSFTLGCRGKGTLQS